MNNGEQIHLTGTAEQASPPYSQQQEDIRKCIDGLSCYAAQLARDDQQMLVTYLRQFVGEIASFWLDSEAEHTGTDTEQAYRAAFDRVIEQSRRSGATPELSEQVRSDVLAGLDMYAAEMSGIDGMGAWVRDCQFLASSLKREWELQSADSHRAGSTMGEMTL